MKEIQLTQGKVALVDDADFDWLNQWKWYAMKSKNTFYAVRANKERQKVLMHRVILGLTDFSLLPDHIDNDGLNNQRSNLRIATQSQNRFNTANKIKGSSKFKGVCITKDRKKWQAHIQKEKQQIYLGCFETEEQAAFAYDQAAIIYHGEFATLNNTF